MDVGTRKWRVVYLAGSGHTGSTLLALLMDSHPAIVSVGEASVKPLIRRRGTAASQPCSCGQAIVACPFWANVFDRVRRDGLRFGPNAWTNDYRLEQPWAHALLTRDSSYRAVQAFQAWAAHSLPVYRRHVHHAGRVNVALIRALLEIAHAEVFFDSSKGVMRLARLMELQELDVKIVTLVRDVRGYAASAKRRGYSIADAANGWQQDQRSIARITQALPPERSMLLRYEDLCATPGQTLERLYRFCGVAAIPPILSTRSDQHHVLGNSMRLKGFIEVRADETWRERLSREEQSRVLDIAGVVNARFGYSS